MEWKTVTAEQFCTRVTDGTHDSPKRQEVGRYLITSKHLSGSDIDFSSAYKISEEDYQKIIVRSNVEQYDILFSMIGTIGNTYRVTEEAVDYAVKNMAIFKFGGNKGDSSWFYYWLKSPQAQAYISQMQAGSTQGYLTLATLRSFPVAVPDHATQDKIVAILSSLDDKIENNNRINRNLEAQAQALFKSWFVDFEPWGGSMPEDWKEGVLSDIADITMGQSPRGESYNTQGEGVIFYQGCSDFGDRFPSVRMFTTEPARYAVPNSILMSVRAPVGTMNVALEECCIGRGLASLKEKNSYDSFLLYLLESLQNVFDSYNGDGTVFGSINKKSIGNIKIVIPSIKVVESFHKMVSPLDEKIKFNHQESARLATLRDTLLPKLMKGEIEI